MKRYEALDGDDTPLTHLAAWNLAAETPLEAAECICQLREEVQRLRATNAKGAVAVIEAARAFYEDRQYEFPFSLKPLGDALAAFDALTGGQYAEKEGSAQPRWVVGGCYEDNRLRLIEGRVLGVHEQLTLVEASE